MCLHLRSLRMIARSTVEKEVYELAIQQLDATENIQTSDCCGRYCSNIQNKRQLILYLEKSNFNVLHQLHLGW
jgi:hypothetical protein